MNWSLMALLLLIVLLIQQAAASPLLLLNDVLSGAPPGVTVLYQGAPYVDFDRPLPRLIDPSVLAEFEETFNRTQEFHADGSNTFSQEGAPFVVSITHGRVTGVLGAVYDDQGHVYADFTPSLAGLPKGTDDMPKCTKSFKRLATGVQKYGHMYYHFLLEVLPRLLLLVPHLKEDTKLLMFGAGYEAGWLNLLGIPADAIEIYDPTQTYCADELIVPSATTVITPPKEGYELVRDAVGASDLVPAEDRNLVIYCSRRGASERRVSKEDELIARLQNCFPSQEIVVFTGEGMTPAQTVALFKRARVVLGVHGAGLSHSIFSAPDTAIIELLFMADPPLMFWHLASALNQTYVMVPVPQSWWLASTVDIAEQDVVDALALALGQGDASGCASGSFWQNGACTPCPSSTYRFGPGSTQCVPCEDGSVAPFEGSAVCKICPKGTFSVDGLSCEECAQGMSTMFPGASFPEQCATLQDLDYEIGSMFDESKLAAKLVSVPALISVVQHAEHALRRSIFFRRNLLHDLVSIQDTQLNMLEDLFNTPRHEGCIEEDVADADAEVTKLRCSSGREMLQYTGRRLSSYSAGRSISGYSSGRRLSSYSSGRRLASYSTSLGLLSSGTARSLSSYSGRDLQSYRGRSMLSYSETDVASHGSRRLMSYGRKLLAHHRRLSMYTRKLSMYGRRLSGQPRRLQQDAGGIPRYTNLPNTAASLFASFKRRILLAFFRPQ